MGCKRNQTAIREGGRGEVDLGIMIIIEKLYTSMWVYYHVGEDRGQGLGTQESRKWGGGGGRRWEFQKGGKWEK